jgi:hypothetical protein
MAKTKLSQYVEAMKEAHRIKPMTFNLHGDTRAEVSPTGAIMVYSGNYTEDDALRLANWIIDICAVTKTEV